MAWHTSLVFLLSFCSIVLSLDFCDNEQLCDSEPTTGLKKCKYFDPAQFNEDSPSIVYGKITYTVHFFACDIYMYIVTRRLVGSTDQAYSSKWLLVQNCMKISGTTFFL